MKKLFFLLAVLLATAVSSSSAKAHQQGCRLGSRPRKSLESSPRSKGHQGPRHDPRQHLRLHRYRRQRRLQIRIPRQHRRPGLPPLPGRHRRIHRPALRQRRRSCRHLPHQGHRKRKALHPSRTLRRYLDQNQRQVAMRSHHQHPNRPRPQLAPANRAFNTPLVLSAPPNLSFRPERSDFLFRAAFRRVEPFQRCHPARSAALFAARSGGIVAPSQASPRVSIFGLAGCPKFAFLPGSWVLFSGN